MNCPNWPQLLAILNDHRQPIIHPSQSPCFQGSPASWGAGLHLLLTDPVGLSTVTWTHISERVMIVSSSHRKLPHNYHQMSAEPVYVPSEMPGPMVLDMELSQNEMKRPPQPTLRTFRSSSSKRILSEIATASDQEQFDPWNKCDWSDPHMMADCNVLAKTAKSLQALKHDGTEMWNFRSCHKFWPWWRVIRLEYIQMTTSS